MVLELTQESVIRLGTPPHGKSFAKLFKKQCIKFHLPYYSYSTGRVEKVNEVIKPMLKKTYLPKWKSLQQQHSFAVLSH